VGSAGRVEHVAGRVEGIFITDTKRVLPEPVERVEAVAGTGLHGNRYFYADGAAPPGRAITLIAAEALEAYEAETGKSLSAAESRRNVLVRGVDVNALVGKRFRIGDVECEGVELCEPCSTLESMTHPGVIKGMVHRAGLNADVLSTGEIAVGDAVTVA
jgi:MOSC domain-containing protein YiiM